MTPQREGRLIGDQKLGTTMLYVSNDLPSVATISHRVAVMGSACLAENINLVSACFLHLNYPVLLSLGSSLEALLGKV